ncbi:MAG: TolC family protein, partial [Pseudobdellovibrionaceae bacterium]|nr:TolC family protein [Pseudobdellovibrionaceae bacterium]
LLAAWPFSAAAQESRLQSTDPKKFLESLPDGKLTLDVILARARDTSQTFAAIQSLKSSAEASEIRAEAGLQPVLSAEFFSTDNRLEPSNPFQPERLQSTSVRAGVTQSFLTGTTLDFGFRTGPSSLTLPPMPGSPRLIEFDESRFDISLSQNLLRDQFGEVTKANYQLNVLEANILREQRRAEIENFTLAIVDDFYRAWLAQIRVQDATETLKRRQRIQKITRLRLARGTAERPEILETESSVVAADVEVRSAADQLRESWLRLATVIDLPDEITQSVDPTKIPLGLDKVDARAESICQSVGERKGSASLAQALAELKRADAVVSQARLNDRADLKLEAKYFGNGIDSSITDSAVESLRSRHPAWELALRFQMPMGRLESKALMKETQSQRLRAVAQAEELKDQEQVSWSMRCREIGRRVRDLRILRDNAKRQTERARLEQDRFDIGRITLTEVTRAEDEALQARIRLREEEIALRRTVWSLRELAGQIPETMEVLP